LSQGVVQAAEGIQILDDKEGFGQHAVQQGDLVLVHYTGMTTNSQRLLGCSTVASSPLNDRFQCNEKWNTAGPVMLQLL
jgi:hypothetical protein